METIKAHLTSEAKPGKVVQRFGRTDTKSPQTTNRLPFTRISHRRKISSPARPPDRTSSANVPIFLIQSARAEQKNRFGFSIGGLETKAALETGRTLGSTRHFSGNSRLARLPSPCFPRCQIRWASVSQGVASACLNRLTRTDSIRAVRCSSEQTAPRTATISG
jgi:hypothetical protein